MTFLYQAGNVWVPRRWDDTEGTLPPMLEQLNDALFPKTAQLMKSLGLPKDDKEALIAFLQVITG